MLKTLWSKLKESLVSILPVSAVVLIIALTLIDVPTEYIWAFVIGTVLLIVGMMLFSLGSDVAMIPMGNAVGSFLSRPKRKYFPLVLFAAFLIGAIITIAEPDLLVLATQLGKDGNMNVFLLLSVAVGVGLFLMVSVIRTFFNLKLKYILLGAYVLAFALGIALNIVNPNALAVAFDSGGVTTGPITVPFLMALGIGLAAVRNSKEGSDDSFGMVALCSIGPILAVLIMGLLGLEMTPDTAVAGFTDGIGNAYLAGFLTYLLEVAVALIPIIVVFLFFQIFFLKLPKGQVIRILIGLLYTYVGLVIFLTGVNVGFSQMGMLTGFELALKPYKWLLLPLGMVLGALIVLAEPAVHVLNKQVEEVTGGSISRKVMMVALSVGVAVAIGLSMLRVLLNIHLFWFLIPVYVISLALMFFVPPIFTGIAFDSGGVASGPLTATFLLPLAVGAVSALSGGDTSAILNYAYGLVAFVAMTPLITIQLVGLVYKIKSDAMQRAASKSAAEVGSDDELIEFDEDDEIIEFGDISGDAATATAQQTTEESVS